jgi:hypothetical protein
MMKLLPLVALAIAGTALIGCGTTRENRFNETAYADHNTYDHKTYDHDVVYRSPAYGERYYYDDDGRLVEVRPAYRVAEPPYAIYGDDGYYYYRD